METVYLDNGATTKVDRQVADAALEMMLEVYGNPSSAHRLGAEAQRRLGDARRQLAAALSADPQEITFTSGGTEANALGVLGAAAASRGRHLVTTALEHPSVADSARHLAQSGWELSTVAPDTRGLIAPEALERACRPDTAVCALLWVQNELGCVQPLELLCQVVRRVAPRCHIHVDAVQAVGKLPVDVAAGAFDSLSLSGHKLHAPKGAGALWLRPGRRLAPLAHGGGQERGLRPGTEGVPQLVALGLAVELAERARPTAAPEMARLRDRLWDELAAACPGAVRHVPAADGAPHILSVGFPYTPAEPLLHALEARGVFASAGSACHAKDKRPSPVLQALALPEHMGTLRFSLSRHTTPAEIDRAARAVPEAVAEVRAK
jgi:cysteine desulfurase